jgi:uncharacterized protein (DUF362 family)
MKPESMNRRQFLRCGAAVAAGAPLWLRHTAPALFAAETEPTTAKPLAASLRSNAKVAIVECRSYGPEVRAAFGRSFDLLGGIGSLVKNKTVTVKLNLTATDFSPFLGRPVGETFMTHEATVQALTAEFFAAGARRVRLVESTQSKARLRSTLALADWDVNALEARGRLEFENTRNLGESRSYSRLNVPSGGYMFSAFEFNRAYEETDVMVSLCKLKNHITAGVTLSMKNLFGITPNALYGDQAGSEEATAGRGPLHNPRGFEHIKLPGLKEDITQTDPTWRVPRIIADLCGARPIDLAIIDGITSMSGGEGPWCGQVAELKVTTPGVLIVGLNGVSTDAVGTAVMGYPNPRAARGTKPFHFCDNHLLLAEQAGLGTADLSQIEVRGLAIEKVRYPYA